MYNIILSSYTIVDCNGHVCRLYGYSCTYHCSVIIWIPVCVQFFYTYNNVLGRIKQCYYYYSFSMLLFYFINLLNK